MASNYLKQLEDALGHKDAVDRWSELNTQFHLSLYAGTYRPHTIDVVKGLNTKSDRYIRLQLLAGGRPIAEQEHRQLLQLCASGDATGAAKLLHTHIQAAAISAKQHLAQQMQRCITE